MNQVFGGAPPPRSSSPWAWCLWIVIVGGLLLVLAMVALVAFGWSLFADEAKSALQDDPAIQQHIGTIQTLDLDITATGDAEGSDEFVWDVTGDKGSGRVLAELVTEDDGERLHSGTLTLPDGREVPLGVAPEEATPPADAAPSDAAGEGKADGNLKVDKIDKPFDSGAPDEPVIDKGGTEPAPEPEPEPGEPDPAS